MSRVFIPHRVLKNGVWRFDVEPIEAQYGSIIPLLPSSAAVAIDYLGCIDLLSVEFHKHDFDPLTDYFLAAGDMTVYGTMLVISHSRFGLTPKQLRWFSAAQRYDVLPAMRHGTTA